MRTIWKFSLDCVHKQSVRMPVDAQILTIQMQGHAMTLWALCTPDLPTGERELRMYGTGMDIPEPRMGRYIATVQDTAGLVWHFFEPIGQRIKPPTTGDH